MAKNICVVGSARMDLQVQAPKLPEASELVVGESFELVPGGRGLLHAVACSRLGAQVSFVGCIGDDAWGAELRTVMTADGVDIQQVRTVENTSTGVGLVTTLADGTSGSVLVAGANGSLAAADVEEAAKEIRAADLLILQGEVPQEANLRALEIAKESTKVLFHTTPAASIDPLLLQDVDLIVSNREESGTLLGDTSGDVAPAGLARRIACLGAERVVIHLGAEGAIHFNGQEVKNLPAVSVDGRVDDQGVEDAFVGALATARSEGARLKDAVAMACAAASLAQLAKGSLDALPTREKIEELLRRETR